MLHTKTKRVQTYGKKRSRIIEVSEKENAFASSRSLLSPVKPAQSKPFSRDVLLLAAALTPSNRDKLLQLQQHVRNTPRAPLTPLRGKHISLSSQESTPAKPIQKAKRK